MVGWSRRGRESRERQRRFHAWWATLTDEEKRAYEKEREEERRQILKWLTPALIISGAGFVISVLYGVLSR
jgi:uncharacterized Ntn-hydrolase superfamily protein